MQRLRNDPRLGRLAADRGTLLAVSLFVVAYLGGAVGLDLSVFPVVCPFRLITGLPCPLCGLTYALHVLSRGDWSAAFQAHPLVVPFLAFLLYLAIAGLRCLTKSMPNSHSRIAWVVLFALFVGTFALRML